MIDFVVFIGVSVFIMLGIGVYVCTAKPSLPTEQEMATMELLGGVVLGPLGLPLIIDALRKMEDKK